jgi:site-specific DNA recombinase
MEEELVADRLVELRTTTKQSRSRRDELTLSLDAEPTAPEKATLTAIANRITEIITTGSHNKRKALVEALVAMVIVTGPNRLRPVFRIPTPPTTTGPHPPYQRKQPRRERFA